MGWAALTRRRAWPGCQETRLQAGPAESLVTGHCPLAEPEPMLPEGGAGVHLAVLSESHCSSLLLPDCAWVSISSGVAQEVGGGCSGGSYQGRFGRAGTRKKGNSLDNHTTTPSPHQHPLPLLQVFSEGNPFPSLNWIPPL